MRRHHTPAAPDQSRRLATYVVADDQMAVGSTLGSATAALTIKATGAVNSVFSIALGHDVFGSLTVHHWDAITGVRLERLPGEFIIHPEHQEHSFSLANGVHVREDIFALNGGRHADTIDPPAVYYVVDFVNEGSDVAHISSYAFCQLRGAGSPDVIARYDRRLHAFIIWNTSDRHNVRIFRASCEPVGFETTSDHAKAIAQQRPGALSGKTGDAGGDPLAIFELKHDVTPGKHASFHFLLTFLRGNSRSAAALARSCPSAKSALTRTTRYYSRMLRRAMVLTPDEQVNRGVLWAKANMLRVQTQAPTGWSFTNDPLHSSFSVARDTAWYAYGADYLTPPFADASLQAYVKRQMRNGKIPEFYDIRTGRAYDYGLNINDDTPLLILALWHHYCATGDRPFLRHVYAAARKAACYILSQRDKRGLVWCSAHGTGTEGIVGWRNVISGYRLSGATTEINSECYAALVTTGRMARELDKHSDSAFFEDQAAALHKAINRFLTNPENGLYYLNIPIDGAPRSDVTADLVFPVMFGVASREQAARIIARLSDANFWTNAGIRTIPRDAPDYSPGARPGYGLLGGVWVAVSFWYAFAAAPFVPDFMAYALATSFRHYSQDPRRNNTVPGQFAEWLHGETLVNQGMTLSPWFAPRYLWAAIEGAAGLVPTEDPPRVAPRLAPDWKWLAALSIPCRGRMLSWLAVRIPDVHLYATFYAARESAPQEVYANDVSSQLHSTSEEVVAVGLSDRDRLVFFAGNTQDHSVATALQFRQRLRGRYHLRWFDSLLGTWQDGGLIAAPQLARGLAVRLERKGFWIIELDQET